MMFTRPNTYFLFVACPLVVGACTTPMRLDAGDLDAGPDTSVALDAFVGLDAFVADDVGLASDAGSDGGLDGSAIPDGGSASDTGIDANAPRACGARGTQPCHTGEYCDFPLTANCGVTGSPGTCAAIPTVCRGASSVCGCDGTTYTTACAAAMQSISVAHTGACP